MSELNTNTIKVVKEFSKHYTDNVGEVETLNAVSNLQEFGYLDKKEVTEEDVYNAVLLYKQFNGIEEKTNDGVLDIKVVKHMIQPRCGVMDVAAFRNRGARASNLPKWGLSTITWYIEKYVVNRDEQDELSTRALEYVSKVCNLKFKQVSSSNKANVIISASGNRRSGLGSRGSTLAFAYLAPNSNYRGQLSMYFDTAESWNYGTEFNKEQFYGLVFLHEYLHILGISHIPSSSGKALINPIYNSSLDFDKLGGLQPLDIQQLQARYGKSVNQPKPDPEPDPKPDPKPDPPTGNKKKLMIEFDGNVTDISIPGYRCVKIS